MGADAETQGQTLDRERLPRLEVSIRSLPSERRRWGGGVVGPEGWRALIEQNLKNKLSKVCGSSETKSAIPEPTWDCARLSEFML